MNYSIMMFIAPMDEDIGGHIRQAITMTDEAIDSADPAEMGRIVLEQMKEARAQIIQILENRENTENQK